MHGTDAIGGARIMPWRCGLVQNPTSCLLGVEVSILLSQLGRKGGVDLCWRYIRQARRSPQGDEACADDSFLLCQDSGSAYSMTPLAADATVFSPNGYFPLP